MTVETHCYASLLLPLQKLKQSVDGPSIKRAFRNMKKKVGDALDKVIVLVKLWTIFCRNSETSISCWQG